MKLLVNRQQRYAKMRAHTATHLLHFALEHILGQTKQAGSLVDEDYLRFDFATKKPLTDTEIATIESMINQRIYAGYDVSVNEHSIAEAKELGAKAFFEDKYGETVRVVTVHGSDSDIPLRSVELCGGTHVTKTDHIGGFIIESQESVASGIRRIIAHTGVGVAQKLQEEKNTITQAAGLLGCQPKQLIEKIEKLLQENKSLNASISSLQDKAIQQTLESIPPLQHDYVEYAIATDTLNLGSVPFKSIVNQAKETFPKNNVLLYSSEGTFALYAGKTNDAKNYAKNLQIQGGGSDQLVQGKDTEITKKMNIE